MSIPAQALVNLQESLDLLSQLAEMDDANLALRWQAMARRSRVLQIRIWTEPPANLWSEVNAHKLELDAFFLEENPEEFETSVNYAEFLIFYAQFAWLANENEKAELALNEAADRLTILVNEKPENRSSRRLLARAWFEYWTRHSSLPSAEATAMLEDYLVDPERATSCADASLAARLEIMRGNISLARDYTLYLLGKGFYEPGFVAFCKRNDMCDK